MAEDVYFPAYFRDWNAIRSAATSEQIGTLFLACLDYAEKGVFPESFQEPQLSAFFALLSGGIDRTKTYTAQKAQKSRYARYCGTCKASGADPLPFELWESMIDERQRTSTNVNECDNQSKAEQSISKQSISKQNREAIFSENMPENVQKPVENSEKNDERQRTSTGVTDEKRVNAMDRLKQYMREKQTE